MKINNTKQYFENLEREVKKVYKIAEEARAKNLDPVTKVEIPLAMTMAEKVVGLISTIYPQMEGSGIAKRILELEKEYGKIDPAIAFKISEEVAKQKFCKFSSLLEAITAGIRIGFAYITLGVVSSPIEGFTELKLKKTTEGKDYFVAYFSGPIRSAGTTASCLALILINYLRELFGYAKYDPTEEEIKRTYAELEDYHERITNLQYMPTREEAVFLAQNLPIQINGEPTEKIEVSNYKNLERIETNLIRGGFCLIIGEGLAQKAKKGLRLLNELKSKGFKSNGFDFLAEYVKLHEKRDKGKTQDSPTYIKDLVAGRPIFGHPSRSGAFRFRYGRSRTSGFSAVSINPATMIVTDNFLATGTQMKLEKPTKGCVVTSCDTIDGPIVKLQNGSVKKLNTKEEARKWYKEINEIIYLGDILLPFSDVSNRNSELIKPGYVEEWWEMELKEKDEKIEREINFSSISFEKAVEISNKYLLPLHPRYIYYWTQISNGEFFELIGWLKNSRVNKRLILPFNKSEKEKFNIGKRALELLGVPHEVTTENVVLDEQESKIFLFNLGIDPFILNQENFFMKEIIEKAEEKILLGNIVGDVLEKINSLSKVQIKDKAGDFVGSRMGRPEKAKLRKLIGSPNVLFPVGKEGGRLRSVQAACEKGEVNSTFPIYYCEKCKIETIYPSCENCEEKCKKMFYFSKENEKSLLISKEGSEEKGVSYCTFRLDINHYFKKSADFLGLSAEEIPLLIKGIRGTSSSNHKMENLCKGFLRARHDLQVNKDGTIRFDATELPLVAFKPKEISVSIRKLKELGYIYDIFGEELVSDEQILELMPHDVILPSASSVHDEKGDEVFLRVCDFIDELLVRFYKQNPFYKIKKREDLIGQIGVCMAPHNCAGVICRFIGFSNVLGLFASPYMHAAIRRDCDGDEVAIMLLADVLINFSREFLPNHRGGTQDAPLVLNAKINAGEVDEQILDFELVRNYPLELYKLAEVREHSSKLKLNDVRTVLKEGRNPFIGLGYTHETADFNEGVSCSNYKLLGTMQEKVQHQMELVEKIRAVDTSDTARLIIERHFITDIRGNLRKFSMQGFRCVACNEIMRRPPLMGICPKCGGKIIFTINEGGIKKYMELALELANRYNLSLYIRQNLELTKRYIDSIFGRELEKQENIARWF